MLYVLVSASNGQDHERQNMNDTRKFQLLKIAFKANGRASFASKHQLSILRSIAEAAGVGEPELSVLLDEMTPFLNASAMLQYCKSKGFVEVALTPAEIAERNALIAELGA